MEKRVYHCPKCSKRIMFEKPQKPGVYRITCPFCLNKILFKVIDK